MNLVDIETKQSLKNALNLPIQFYGDRQLHQQAWEILKLLDCAETLTEREILHLSFPFALKTSLRD